ncbi:MAG TPA: DUF6636 domain-containing protein [Mycobacterium sp.]|nr:DUF6636 domain-containing protein [Mycobacterium sp.]
MDTAMNPRGKRVTAAFGVAAGITASVALGLTAPMGHADDNSQQFASPSGNIRCILSGPSTPQPGVMCQIKDVTYSVAPGTARDQNGAACPPPSDSGHDFSLDQGASPHVACTYSAIGSGFGVWQPLDYGQARSLGTISCASEADGMVCTDASTGHFFRVSRDSYQLG